MKETANITALLQSSTYQGMTDDEIQAIIDYKVARAEANAVVSADAAAHERIMNAFERAQAKAVADSRDALERAIKCAGDYKEVRP